MTKLNWTRGGSPADPALACKGDRAFEVLPIGPASAKEDKARRKQRSQAAKQAAATRAANAQWQLDRDERAALDLAERTERDRAFAVQMNARVVAGHLSQNRTDNGDLGSLGAILKKAIDGQI